MSDADIARVQLRKAAQQIGDLQERMRSELGSVLSAGMQQGLQACVGENTWILGRGYGVDEPQPSVELAGGGVVLTSESSGEPRLLLQFLGRTNVPPFGGFAADVHTTTPGGWQHLIGLKDWEEDQLRQLPELWSDLPDPP